MEQTPASRKKRGNKRSSSPDSDSEKKRGRPRVEKQDESAADRRRTQIRMAQRAYRQRKESTLDELRKRVSDLTNTIEMMNKAFLDCRDRLYASSNITHDQMIDLSDLSMQFDSFIKETRNPDEEDPETSKPLRKASSSSKTVDAQSESLVEVKNVNSWLDESVVALSNRPKADSSLTEPMGYAMYMPESDDNLFSMDFSSTSTNSQALVSKQKPFPSLHQASFDAFRAELISDHSFPMTNQIDPPRTFSWQEGTFARRLYRTCLERAYQLLLDPKRRPADFDRIFKLSLMGRDLSKLVASVKRGLDKGPHEELDNWQAPLIHVGGAGTHYGRRDPFGNLMPRKVSHNLGIIGPQTLALLDNAARDGLSTDMTVEIAGFEGEWFDPYDVQGYLEEKGIYIDPSSSFAEAHILETPQTPTNISSISSTGIQPQTPVDTLLSQQLSSPSTVMDLDTGKGGNANIMWDDFSNMELGQVGFSDAQGWMNFLQPGQSIKEFSSDPDQILSPEMTWGGMDGLQNSLESNAPSPQRKEKAVIIDVTKLVEALTYSSVCLGRAPGFRRKDVDTAIALASFGASDAAF